MKTLGKRLVGKDTGLATVIGWMMLIGGFVFVIARLVSEQRHADGPSASFFMAVGILTIALAKSQARIQELEKQIKSQGPG